MLGKHLKTSLTRKDQVGDKAYDTALRGRALLETLDELARIFWTKRTWAISREDIQQPGHEVLLPSIRQPGPTRLKLGTWPGRARSRYAIAVGISANG
jgi:hypothetical protein